MLHRSFKPAKCKTALKLSVSRIKLLKNKREAHLRQARRELAQLLDTGQERTARIRVEHVVREEKTLAAYDLLEVYCELIAARLPIIESQKNCPIDLKEAIASVIFASPRCDDLPELVDIRKHLQAKYGKEFTNAALELRPGCGVGRMLIEKLSTVAPDVQTKTKILSAIAEEHNIKWDPLVSEEMEKPPEDLLNGPNTFQNASEKYAESQIAQAPINNTQRHDEDASHYGQSSAPSSQKIGSTTMSGSSHPQMGNPSTRGEATEHIYSFSGDERQNWNMDFKDATSAAHAAAEAAECASMAARAAVELSSGGKFTRQHSSESQSSSVDASRNGTLGKRTGKFTSNVTVGTEPVDNKVLDGNPVVQAEPTKSTGQSHTFHRNERQETHKNVNVMQSCVRAGTNSDSINSFNKRAPKVERTEVVAPGYQTVVNEQFDCPSHASSRSNSLKSSTSCHEDNTFTKSFCDQDRYCQTMPFDEQTEYQDNDFASEAGPEKQSSLFENDTEREGINYFADEIMHGQPSNVSSPIHSANSDEHADPYIDNFDDRTKEKYHTQHVGTAVFDQSGSDTDEGYKFDTTSNFRDERPDPLMSPDQRHESPKQNMWFATETKRVPYELSPFQSLFVDNESSSPDISSKVAENEGSSDFQESLPVTFDLSDNETEPGRHYLDASPTYNNSSKHGKLHTGSTSKVDSTPFHAISDERLEQHMETSSSDSDNSLLTMESTFSKKDERNIDRPGFDTGKELKLGMLRGGFHNRGFRQPPYIKSPSSEDPPFPSKQAPENDSAPPARAHLSSTAEELREGLYEPKLDKTTDMNSSPRLQTTVYDFEDDSEGKLTQTTVRHNKERRRQNISPVVSNTSFNSQPAYPDSEDPENDGMTAVKVSHNKPRLGSGLSRRTRTSTLDRQRKPSRETYGGAPASPAVQTQTPTIREEQLKEPLRIPKLTISNSGSEVANKRSAQPSSARKQPEYSSNVIKPNTNAVTGNPSNLKAQQQQPPSRQDSTGKASHVHPKLPDFDTLAAHLNTFRTNKQ